MRLPAGRPLHLQLLLATIYSPVAAATDSTFVADLTRLVSKFSEPDPLRLTVACMYAGKKSMLFCPLYPLAFPRSVMFVSPRAPGACVWRLNGYCIVPLGFHYSDDGMLLAAGSGSAPRHGRRCSTKCLRSGFRA